MAKKIMKKLPVRKMVTRSISRALRGNFLSLRDLNSFVKISRNFDLERMVLTQRNVPRNRRASESNAMPTQNVRRTRHRRGSLDYRRSRRNSIDAPALAAQNPIVPLDEEFIERLNLLAEEAAPVDNAQQEDETIEAGVIGLENIIPNETNVPGPGVSMETIEHDLEIEGVKAIPERVEPIEMDVTDSENMNLALANVPETAAPVDIAQQEDETIEAGVIGLENIIPNETNVPGPVVSMETIEHDLEIEGVKSMPERVEPIEMDVTDSENKNLALANVPQTDASVDIAQQENETNGSDVIDLENIIPNETNVSGPGSSMEAVEYDLENMDLNSANVPEINAQIKIEDKPENVKQQTLENGSISSERKPFKTLPAPFHVKGRRPSLGCNKMRPIIEE